MMTNVAACAHPDFEKWIAQAEMVVEELKTEDDLRYLEEPLEVEIDNAVCFWFNNAQSKESLYNFLRRSFSDSGCGYDDCDERICSGEEEWC